MKKLNLFFALVLGLFIISCGNNENAADGTESDATTEEHQDQTAATEADEHQGQTVAATPEKVEAPQKDASGKWIANPETTAGINEMTEMIKQVSSKMPTDGKTKMKVFRKMSVKLQEEMDNIFNKCTMTGEAHEELHTFLLPMVDMIKTMGEKGEEDCDKAMNDLKSHLDTYNNTFTG